MADDRPRRLLLVEDDPGFQLLIQRILERMTPPCAVEVVESAAALPSRLAAEPYDLVLLDYSLPGRNGLEVMRDLGAAGITVPVVMVTGMGNEMVAVDALKLGAYDYLVKSGELRTSLPLVVRRVLEKVELEDGLQRFREENERLRELDRLKSQFIANVSHELRTPLVSVAGYTEMLLSGQLGAVTAEQRRALLVCSRNAERLKVLIDNILSLSSLEAHKVLPAPRPFDLASLLQDRLAAIRPQCEPRGVALGLDLDGDGRAALGDPDLIEQVLWNLLSNAQKFTPDGGRVDVRLRHRGDGIAVEIADTGCGIAEEHLSRIFDRFWQADASPTRPYPGLGIGLSIVREILEAHGAPMSVSSRLGEGTTFTFELPAANLPAAKPAPARRTASTSPARELTVMVVDDEADTREFVKTALEMAGHRVLLASGGREALQVLRGARVDAMLLDIAMRDMSGIEVLVELRRSEGKRSIPVLLLTAIADRAIKEEGLRAGAAGVVEKPLRTSQLLAALESVAAP